MAEPSRKFRCAVYTRKSTEDGLEQEFNSLDAQHEACKAYILSQRHEGWSLVPDRYDDGGFSGGSLERPGLKKLLEQVSAGKVDIIVIYKVDRLTRSLADFAKIVDVLDGAGASFVSITQSFNTTTSMGRLTLNMLLSFAQFEREVTGERIRDKIAASKRRGLWMGGPVPLGYEVRERKLVVNEAEAETVRHVMRRYCELNSVRELVAELRRDGVVTKVQTRVSGPHRGGIPFARGALYHLLKNRIYRGEIVHKGVAYLGEQAPIVPIELWDRVQAILTERATCAGARTGAKRSSLLAGLCFDGLGRPMVPSHTTKGCRSYRYYVTRPDRLADAPAWRTGAHDLEKIVRSGIAQLLGDPFELTRLMNAEVDLQQVHEAQRRAASLSEIFNAASFSDCFSYLQQLVRSVGIQQDQISIEIDRPTVVSMLEWPSDGSPDEPATITLTCAATRVRRGHALRLLMPVEAVVAERTPRREEKLIRLIAEAHAARQLIEAAPDKPLSKIALEQKRCRTRLAGLVAISCLAPDIALAIVKGEQPKRFNRRTLLSGSLPLEWLAQREFLGFADGANAARVANLDD
jgi:DNA invertase Pin-like site-specific DNA recombinase